MGWRRGRFIACHQCGSGSGRFTRDGSIAAVLPPARNHAQYADQQSQGKSAQNHQNQRSGPLLAKEKSNSGIVLVVQRESEKGKKNGRFK
ncbi:MAG: hypothetical protein A3F78_10510 [Burkholderiales bacterium RIFCSPLOWO2_12_FULL_61_40]|nr:MAG: hypothetical protein A3F78_10510 [Burkholderiales bacterium RIFCSPLOWO2_12_FULL_61_40]